MHAQDDHPRRPRHLLGSRRDLDPIQLGHADVQHQQVGALGSAQPHRLQTVGRFPDDGMSFFFEQGPQATPDDAVIVGQYDAHRSLSP